jgi:predicted lipid-binding transport protein (Tim44 family)
MITDRQTQGRRLNIEVQGVRACHIAALRLQGSIADIDLEIVADALMQEYDRDGILRGGHPDKTTELRDKWTFSRDLSQRDPTWRVSAIHDEISA